MAGVIKFNRCYFAAAMLILLVETGIASFMHDQLIRPYGGDVLVVVLIYCMIKSIADTPVMLTAVCVLIFAFTIESMQYFNAINRLGLEHSTTAKLLIGTSFEWVDMIAYCIGTALTLSITQLLGAIK